MLASLEYVVLEAVFWLFEERPKEDWQELAQREIKEYELQEPEIVSCIWLIEEHIDPLNHLEQVADCDDR